MAKITQSYKIFLLTSKICLGCKSPLTHIFLCFNKICEIVLYSVIQCIVGSFKSFKSTRRILTMLQFLR